MTAASRSRLLTDKNSYQSWPVITRLNNGTIVVAYSSGAGQHPADNNRGVYVIQSTDEGINWSAPIQVVNSSTADESTFGIGLNTAGDLLLWVRVVVGTTFNSVLYASTDNGLTWSVRATPTFDAQPILISPIVNCNGVLYSPVHCGPESGELERSWGHLVSTDDGLTWTQVTIGTSIDDENWPVEPRYYVSTENSNNILAIARHKTEFHPLWQYWSTDGGLSWTEATATNITDQNNTPTTLTGSDENLFAVYFDRTNSLLRSRNTTLAQVFDNPTGWPNSTVIAYGTKFYLDNGYPHAITTADKNSILCVYYAGMYRYPGIYLTLISSNVQTPPPAMTIIDKTYANPAGILVPHSGDISWDLPTSKTSPTLVGYGITRAMDEAFTWGKLYWRLESGGQVNSESGDELTISAHYYRDSGNRADPTNMELKYTLASNVVKDTGWIPMPNDFSHLDASNLPKCGRVEIRARLKSGASGAARIFANATLSIGVR